MYTIIRKAARDRTLNMEAESGWSIQFRENRL
jgi:hypothetical protein